MGKYRREKPHCSLDLPDGRKCVSRIGRAIARKAAIANKLQILSPPRLRVELDTIDPTYLPRGRLPIKECVWFYRVTFMDDQAAWMSNRGAFTVTMSGAVATLQSGNGE